MSNFPNIPDAFGLHICENKEIASYLDYPQCFPNPDVTINYQNDHPFYMLPQAHSTFLQGPFIYEYGNPHPSDEGRFFSHEPLQVLEQELVQLLLLQNRKPIGIANLHNMYQLMYQKPLRAEGYLTERQRNGRTGFSLTKLLERMDSISLIIKANGQHDIVLANEASKSYVCRNERIGSRYSFPASQQIYLTFSPNSTFTDKDIENYFKRFGRVLDVRVPPQERRQFGFVVFEQAQTVHDIFAHSSGHIICNSQVLVKPYEEKTHPADRKKNSLSCGGSDVASQESVKLYHDVDFNLERRRQMFALGGHFEKRRAWLHACSDCFFQSTKNSHDHFQLGLGSSKYEVANHDDEERLAKSLAQLEDYFTRHILNKKSKTT